MTDEQRPELEWPSEDLAQPRPRREPREDVDWPTQDHAPGETPEPGPMLPKPELAPTPEPESASKLEHATPLAPEPAPEFAPEPELAPPPEPAPEPPPFDIPLTPLEPPMPPPPPARVLPTGLPTPEPPPIEIPPTPPGPPMSEPPLEPPPAPVYPLPPPLPPGPPPGPYGGPPPVFTRRAAGPYALADDLAAMPGRPVSSEAERPHFRPDIEGLRAVAVIAVLLFHIGLPFAAGGFVGVDVFFVISGFLITGLLLREGRETGKVDLLRFYARRMRRLLPAALLVIVVTLAAATLIVSPLRLTEIAGDAAASALYVSNFRFALDATNYLALEAPSPLLHYWSLGVEEQFYLAWPLLLLVAVRFLSMRFVGVFLLLLAIASFGLSLYWTDVALPWAFFSPVTRAWQLAAGALVAVGLLRLPARLPRPTAPIVVVAGLVLIVASVVVLGTETPYPGIAALMPVLGATLVIMGGASRPTLPARVLLANPVARYIGRISYSLYLWHWPLIILLPLAIENDELVVRLALGGVAIVLAAISTELVEQPFRRSSVLSRRSRGSVQLGLSASVAVGVGALLMSGAVSLPSLPNLPANLFGPDPEVVELAGVREDLPRSYRDGCHLPWETTKPRDDCVYGDPDGERTAYLIGDSHAAQWVPALDAYARSRGWRLEVHTKSACSIADVPLWERSLRRVYDECQEWRTALIRRIRRAEPVAVFVGNSRDYELWDNGRIVRTNEAYTYWGQKMTEVLQTLGERANRVVLLAETPFLNFDPVDCLASDRRAACDPPASLVLDTGYAALEVAAADAAGASLLSINELLCPGRNCPVVVDGVVVFRDQHHVTASYMQRLAEPVGNLIEGRAPYPTPVPSAVIPDLAVGAPDTTQ